MARFTATATCGRHPTTGERTVNQYRVQAEVGSGTFCKVKWAVDDGGSGYAVKIFSRTELDRRHVAHFDGHEASTVPLLNKINEEVRLMALFNHANIVPLIEVINDPTCNQFYSVMEGLAGGQLMTWNEDNVAYQLSADRNAVSQHWGNSVVVPAEGTRTVQPSDEILAYSESVARYLFKQMLEAVSYMHQQNVVHKDIKPDNVLLTRPLPIDDARFARGLNSTQWPVVSLQGGPSEAAAIAIVPPTTDEEDVFTAFLSRQGFAVKICDFSSASACAQPTCLIYDADGTQQFTPPECFENSSEGVLGKPRDAWSMGCLLFTMLFGHCAYWDEQPITLQIAIMMEDFIVPGGGIISPLVHSLIRALMQRDPAQRPDVGTALMDPWVVGSVQVPAVKA